MQDHEITVPVNAPVPAPSVPGAEDTCCVLLSERDAAAVLAAIDNPPAPNATALKAAQRYLQKQG